MKKRPWAPPPVNPYEPLILNLALTGAVPTKEDNPSLPTTPDEIVADAIACADRGASIVHIHVRDEDQQPVHDAGLYAEAISGIRASRPELVICTTTTGRAESDFEKRCTSLKLDGELRPDMASLTLGSLNFQRTASANPPDVIRGLLREMNEAGIKPELEVFEPGMTNFANVLVDEGLLQPPLYFNILLGSLGTSPATIGTLAHMVQGLPSESIWAVAGIGRFQRPMTVIAIAAGGNVRTGLEDAPLDINGEPTPNRDRLNFAREVSTSLGRELETPRGARARLGLS